MTSTTLLETAELISRERVAPGFWCLAFRSAGIASRAGAAQYVAIDVPGAFAVRLPLGIWTAERDSFSLLFREWGDRTTRLAAVAPGERLSITGPLGNRFHVPDGMRRPVMVAGGVGVVPFWMLCRDLVARGTRPVVLFGARTKDALAGADSLRRLGADVEVCTDDGSIGHHGSVLDLLRRRERPDAIYGCGPPGMLRALCAYAEEERIPCQISMEETFGCSMGTCWGCVVRVRRGSDQGTGYPKATGERREHDFARVCKDGTVFWSNDVRWPA